MEKNQYIVLPLAAPQEPVKTKITKSQIAGLHKLGKVVLADYPGFPAFNQTEPEKYINRMVDYMYTDDRQAILVILSLFSVLPLFVIRWKLSFIDLAAKWKGMPGVPFRMLQIALKGLIFTLYYSDFTEDKTIHKNIGYDAHIVK